MQIARVKQILQTNRYTLRRFLPVWLAMLLFAAIPFAAQAHVAQQNGGRLPITTGTSKTAMDAPDTNKDLEQYTHSPAVASIAKHLGMSTNAASRLFEDLNSGVLIAVILFYLLRILPGKFRAKRERVARELAEARRATRDAEWRLQQVEAKLQALSGEVEALRAQAAETGRAEEARIHASIEEERKRILHSVEVDIAAAQSNAERGLKRFASDLAVDRAAERVRLSPEGDRALVDEFLAGLAGQLSESGKKWGQN